MRCESTKFKVIVAKIGKAETINLKIKYAIRLHHSGFGMFRAKSFV